MISQDRGGVEPKSDKYSAMNRLKVLLGKAFSDFERCVEQITCERRICQNWIRLLKYKYLLRYSPTGL